MKNYAISRLKHKAVVGMEESGTDDDGFPVSDFKVIKPIWYGNYQLSTSQQITLQGADITINKMIAIRHDTDIQINQHIKLGGDTYKISNISEDDDINAFDIVTLEKIERHGGR